jgi:hypothetical protein
MGTIPGAVKSRSCLSDQAPLTSVGTTPFVKRTFYCSDPVPRLKSRSIGLDPLEDSRRGLQTTDRLIR